MALLTAKEIVNQYEKLQEQRRVTEWTWQEIADNLLGRRDFVTERTPGEQRMRFIYDNTSMLSSDLLAAGLHTLLTNTATRWFELKTEDDRLMERDDVRLWMDDAEDVTLAAFNRPEAAFTPQMHEFYIDLVNFNTAGMFVEDVPEFGASFSSRPLGELFIKENARGKIDTVIRKFKLTARQAVLAWGKDGNVPAAKKRVAQNNAEEKLQYLHMVARNTDPIGDLGPQSMMWGSTYVELDSMAIVSRGGFHEMPYIISRWSKDAGEVYGRGPGWTALSDQKMLNEMSKTILKAAQKATDPPLAVADDGVVSMQTVPGGITVVRSGSFAKDPIRPIHDQARLDIGVEMLERRRVAVRAAYHWDLLQLLQDPRMTATQVIEVATKAQQLLSPILGRQQVEALEPMVDRVFSILLRRGHFLPPPEVLRGQRVKVEYVSPVQRAQKQGDASAIVNTLTIMANLTQVAPSVVDNFDFDEAMRTIADAERVPAKIMRTEREMAEIREAKMKQEQAQQEFNEALQAAEVAGKALPGIAKAEGQIQ